MFQIILKDKKSEILPLKGTFQNFKSESAFWIEVLLFKWFNFLKYIGWN